MLLLDDGEIALEVKDLSRTGICLLHSAALPVGDRRRIQLMLELGEAEFSKPVEVPLRIVWSTSLSEGEVQLGAAFDNLDTAQQQHIESLIFFLTRDVALDAQGRPAFRTGLVPAVSAGGGVERGEG